MGFASDTAQADAELAELVETEKQWQQKLDYATMNPSTTAQELRQLEDQLKRIAMAREELEERVKESHEHDDDPEDDDEPVSCAATSGLASTSSVWDQASGETARKIGSLGSPPKWCAPTTTSEGDDVRSCE